MKPKQGVGLSMFGGGVIVNCTAEICSLKSGGEVGFAVQCRRRDFYCSKIIPIFPRQSIFAAVAFFYSGYLLLMWQLLLMVLLGFTGTLCFFVVERMQNFSADLQEY